MSLKKIISGLFFFCIVSIPVFAEMPLAGIADIKVSRPSFSGAAIILKNHIDHILRTSRVVGVVNSSLLQDQLKTYNCLDDACVLRFASGAGISVIIKGEIRSSGACHEIDLSAFGVDIPHNGKVISRYRVKIDGLDSGKREFSYILEEHAGRFLADVFRNFKTPVYLSGENFPDVKVNMSGTFIFYRMSGDSGSEWFEKKGTLYVKENHIAQSSSPVKENDFILRDYTEQADFLDEFYYGRKREIVLNDFFISDTLYTVLFTVPASAAMPIASPLLGYYQNSDWGGLALWAVNSAPYLYMETRGLLNDPDDLRHGEKDIEKDDSAMRIFSLYMLFTGGTSLFVDAFSHSYLKDASDYRGRKPLMGNPLTAGYLSLISGGGGHFYRGDRFWGYCYFHLNNALLYLTIREFCADERYNESTGEYSKSDINKKKAFTLLGAYGILKTVEIIHAVVSKDRIMNGERIAETEIFQPLVLPDEDSGLKFAFSSTLRF